MSVKALLRFVVPHAKTRILQVRAGTMVGGRSRRTDGATGESIRFEQLEGRHLLAPLATTGYSLSQVNLDQMNQPVVYDTTVEPAPIPARDVMEQADPDSLYHFVLSAVSGATSLSASASLDVSIDHSSSTEFFDSVVATAQAKASFAEIGTVQGADGIPGGTIVVHWTVNGTTALSLATTGGIEVHDISNTARLVSNIPGEQEELIFQDILDTPFQHQPGQLANNVNFSASFPVASGALVFEVDWTAGSSVPLFFDLCLDVVTQFANVDANQVDSGLNLDLSNTANLSIDILDQNGNSISGAELVFETPDNEVSVDIRPFAFPNVIDLHNHFVLPVAIETTSIADGDALDFDATTIDRSTIEFGDSRDGFPRVSPFLSFKLDTDGDGDRDLLSLFWVPSISTSGALDADSALAILTAKTTGGADISGTDSVEIVTPG